MEANCFYLNQIDLKMAMPWGQRAVGFDFNVKII
jgi:hypothetical protein